MTLTDPQSFNRYTYVNNDPINSVDPAGLALADIGVFQTTDPYEAQMAYRQSLADFLDAVNGTVEEQEEPDPPSPPPAESPLEFGCFYEESEQQPETAFTASNGNAEDE